MIKNIIINLIGGSYEQKKIIFSLVFVFALLLGLNINSKAVDDKYTADDFEIVGDTVYGFRKAECKN